MSEQQNKTSEFNFKDKIVIVTGGSRGIGKKIAETFIEHKARVAVMDLEVSMGLLEDLDSQNKKIIYKKTDITDINNVKCSVKEVVDYFGAVHILINNAGAISKSSIENLDIDEWNKVLNINLTGPAICTKAVVPYIKKEKWGRIINISSMQAFMGTPTYSAYAASKAGLSTLTKVWASELVRYNITVNSICPSFVKTEMLEESINRISKDKKISKTRAKKEFTDIIPQKRFLDAKEIAYAALYLSSDYARGITGHDLIISGGLLLR